MEHQLPFSALIAFCVFFFMLLKLWRKSKTKESKPPGPWKLPIIGNIHHLVGSLPHHRLRDLAMKYGPLMHLQLGEIQAIVITSPETAKEVLKTHDITFAQRPFSIAADIVFYNGKDIACAPYGDYWRQLRKICMLELLSSKRVQSFRPIREEEVSKAVRDISWNAGSEVNLSRLLFSLTFGIISRAAFGEIRRDQEKFIELVVEMMALSGGFTIADFFPSVKFLQTFSKRSAMLESLHQEVDKILDNIINEHRARTKGGRDSGDTVDLVDVLLNFQADSELESALETDNIKAVLLDVFIAGGDTSSTTVEWAMSEMLKHPRVMEKAQAEVRQVFGRKGYVDEGGLQELSYLSLVIKETLRLHSPVPLLIPRESKEQCEINGYQIPAKARVLVNVWAIGRDPNYWVDAEIFNPERFLDSTFDYKGTNFEFIPFGAGRRICPGILFGLANVEVALANLLCHFDWKLPGGIEAESLDMIEQFGASVKRESDLSLIPIVFRP